MLKLMETKKKSFKLDERPGNTLVSTNQPMNKRERESKKPKIDCKREKRHQKIKHHPKLFFCCCCCRSTIYLFLFQLEFLLLSFVRSSFFLLEKVINLLKLGAFFFRCRCCCCCRLWNGGEFIFLLFFFSFKMWNQLK